jgi:S-adenosylmethionine:tRNA ribosyltransferase-isomerase
MLDKRESYQYILPPELIAQYPVTPRDHSRLMVVNRTTGKIDEMLFYQIEDYLSEGDRLVFNNTKVIPARLFGNRSTGGRVELLLTEPLGDDCWKAMARPARKLKTGTEIHFSDHLSATVVDELAEGMRIVRFEYEGDFEAVLSLHGEIPLPHYMQRPENKEFDRERYQTVYAKEAGAVAAPTAGLHFTEELLSKLKLKGIECVEVTLHVGIGTFRPVLVETITDHKMHSETYHISEHASRQLNVPSRKEICIGTTSCRTLESASDASGKVRPGSGATEIFIYPGYQFKRVDQLLTNFHLPGSTLLMLVSAFAGHELIMKAYRLAVQNNYRFFSYGDAMLIV